jgi:hypothetical protein
MIGILYIADIPWNLLYIFVLKLRERMCEVLLENHDWSLHLNIIKDEFDCWIH